MIAKSEHVERLWTASDGTTCVLVTGDAPPRYSVTLVRDERVVRERRLYGRASAQMVAEGWSEFRDQGLGARG
jgi:hypothetical protein